MAATSLMSLSPLRPTSDEEDEKPKAFLSLDVSFPDARAPLMAAPTLAEEAPAAVLKAVDAVEVPVVDADVDDKTDTTGAEPVVVEAAPPTGGKEMVNWIGWVGKSPADVAASAEASVILAAAFPLSVCWAAFALGVALLAAVGRGGRGEGVTIPAGEAPIAFGVMTLTGVPAPMGRTVCTWVGPALTRLITDGCCWEMVPATAPTDAMTGGRIPSIVSSRVAKDCLKYGKLFCKTRKTNADEKLRTFS